MSGSAADWKEMAFTILQNGLAHPDEDLWSDMAALMDVKTIRPYASNVTVVDGAKLLTGIPLGDDVCHFLSRFNAIHFSHNMIQTGVLREGESFRDRPMIARNVMALVEQRCHRLLTA